MSGPLFSVVVPTYGRPQFLADAVRSVLAQTVDDLECVVVDDASPEPVTVDGDARVRVVRLERNGGAAAARNAGIEAARGRYVTFLDDDDAFTPDRLDLAVRALEEAPIGLCYRADLATAAPATAYNRPLRGDVSMSLHEHAVPHVGTTAMARELVPRFDARFRVSEDVVWWVDLAQRGPVATVPEVGYLLRQHDGPRQTTRDADRLDCRLRLLREHADYFRARPRAAAYQWKRAGGIAQSIGAHRLARRAYLRSVRARPAVGPLLHAARSLRPTPRELRGVGR